MDSLQDLEREDFIMRRPRPPQTNAAVFTEINNPALDKPAPVHIESLDRFGSVAEARKQNQIKLGHPKLVKFIVTRASLTYLFS